MEQKNFDPRKSNCCSRSTVVKTRTFYRRVGKMVAQNILNVLDGAKISCGKSEDRNVAAKYEMVRALNFTSPHKPPAPKSGRHNHKTARTCQIVSHNFRKKETFLPKKEKEKKKFLKRRAPFCGE